MKIELDEYISQGLCVFFLALAVSILLLTLHHIGCISSDRQSGQVEQAESDE